MTKFKVGDKIRGLENNKYAITNEDMMEAEVIYAYNNEMKIEIINHKYNHYIKQTFDVDNDSAIFELIEKKENKMIRYKDFDWYVLNESEDTVTLFMKDLLSSDVVKDICDDESMYKDNHIRHIKNDEKYSWETSYVRKVLNDKFLEKYLDGNDLVKMDEDYVRLLKLEEIDWDTDIFKADDWYSLMTKMGSSSVAHVSSDGDAHGINAGSYWMAVRPVIEVQKSRLEAKKMTVAQICEELGYEVEIVKGDN